jgi:FHS family glucose/mannose:H+ symporter-like MFS transporter
MDPVMVVAPAPVPAERVGERVFTATAASATCLVFGLMGILAAAYGPLLPLLEGRYSVDPAAAALTISFHAGGAFVGVFVAFRALRVLRNRTFLMLAVAVMSGGCAVFALAPGWLAILLGSLGIGLGFGMLDLGGNQLFAHSFGRRGGTMLNILNGVYGVGAVMGPLLVAAAAGRVTLLYLGLAAFGAALILPLRGVGGDGTPAIEPTSPEVAERSPGQAAAMAAIRIVALFAIANMLYVGIESGVGGWEPSHLEALGLSIAAVSASTSAFWLCLTLGRFLIAPVALRVSPKRIVLASSGTAVVTLALATVPGLAPFAYAATGLALGPIYPTGLAWLAEATYPLRAPTAYVVAAAMLGALIVPPAIGLAIGAVGIAVTPVILAGLAVGTVTGFAIVAYLVRGRAPRHATG